jgi:hypothetical protein
MTRNGLAQLLHVDGPSSYCVPVTVRAVTEEELREAVAGIKWWHSIDLGHGIVTPGLDDSPGKLRDLKLPPRLDDCSVLDIGDWDGFFSFEAGRPGASRVLATDSYAWEGVNVGSKHGFELAREALGSNVEDLHVDPTALSPEAVGETFDVVLFLGVLYHLRDPRRARARGERDGAWRTVRGRDLRRPASRAAAGRCVLSLRRAQRGPDELVRIQSRRRGGGVARGRLLPRATGRELPRFAPPAEDGGHRRRATGTPQSPGARPVRAAVSSFTLTSKSTVCVPCG